MTPKRIFDIALYSAQNCGPNFYIEPAKARYNNFTQYLGNGKFYVKNLIMKEGFILIFVSFISGAKLYSYRVLITGNKIDLIQVA
jgi:hypothetical protein